MDWLEFPTESLRLFSLAAPSFRPPDFFVSRLEIFWAAIGILGKEFSAVMVIHGRQATLAPLRT